MAPKILIILCNDYGELLVSDYFVDNQPIDSLMLCTSKIYNAYDEDNIECREIKSLSDILLHMDSYRPDLVLLASAYLYPLHGIMSLDELKLLVEIVHERKIPLVTTDPWMRSWSAILNNPMIDQSKLHPFQSMQLTLDRFLQPLAHLYAIPFSTKEVNCYGFFNDQAFSPLDKKTDNKVDKWLFTLSKLDFNQHYGAQGAQFIQNLSLRFHEILSNNSSEIVFINPPECTQLLSTHLPRTDRISLIPHCRFSEFKSLSFDCDIGVYWNSLSASIIYHLHKGSAMLFANHGHMVAACPPLLGHVNKFALNGVKATHFNLSKPITQDIIDNTLRIRDEMNEIIYPSYSAMNRPLDLLDGWLTQA